MTETSSYATYRDNQLTIPQDALEDLDIGFVRVSPSGHFKYMNRECCRIAGLAECQGRGLQDIFPDEANYSKVIGNLRRRVSKGFANQYQATLTRRSNGRRVPVNILTMPEINAEGYVVGSIGWVRPALDSVAEMMHERLESLDSLTAILSCMVEAIKPLIPFDFLQVSVYNSGFTHVRELFSYPPKRQSEDWERRWWAISPLSKQLLQRRTPLVIPDIGAWLDEPEHSEFKEEPGIQAYLSLGPTSLLFLPLFRGDRVVASVLFSSLSPATYDDLDRELLRALPLDKAVRVGLYYFDKDDLEFRLRLLQNISSSGADLGEAAQVLVDGIGNHYGWDNVSVFRVDRPAGKIRLLRQYGATEDFRVREDFEVDMPGGVLSHVAENKEAVNIPDVDKSPDYQHKFIRAYARSRSELCLPIVMEEDVHWLLNAEDHHLNAFAAEEQEALTTITNELAALLLKTQRFEVLRAMEERARDGVMRTDAEGIIREVNPAASRMLGYERGELQGSHIAQIVEGDEMGELVAQATEVRSQDVVFRSKDGEPVPALLSAAGLPKDIGGKVYVASDLSARKSMERLEILGDMFYEIAMQTRPPLSLVSSALRRLIANHEGEERATLEGVMRQVRKMQLTFNRLARFEREGTAAPYTEALLSPRRLVETVIEDLPRSEAELVNRSFEEPLPYVRGDVYQLSFCLESILGYLLRFATQKERVQLAVAALADWVSFSIAGLVPEPRLDLVSSYADADWIASTLEDMALGRRVLKEFVANNNGRFTETRTENGLMEYRIDLRAWRQREG